MLNINKLFLALAFLGGSAAAQAGDGRLEPARIEFGKTSERLDDANSWSHGMGQQDSLAGTTGALYSPAIYGSLSGTYNGVSVGREVLLGGYDVTQRLPLSARLSSTDSAMSFHYLS
ncbi:hypothetical protein K5D34_08315 [Pseudomonas cichorii]|nr:hypothetical protein [Pseudomonas cichorii]MBX8509675.1 hypothetical protein [Pseudomonas cichorii]MBX8524848.1 hypothetical protein [Pseudomonas cichorii]MBX8533382.1 hypothetical protein [Pseudomonas cichorii]MBX8568415.1 hypothetical protein [Pseudomonas cichorii]MBX8603866.1 hypothetical protein [Pseudomonas cichorii]